MKPRVIATTVTQLRRLPISDADLAQLQDAELTGYGREAGQVGMVNLGNTCWMNSLLQVILHVPPIVTFFLDGRHEEDFEENRLTMHTVALMACMWKVSGAMLSYLLYLRHELPVCLALSSVTMSLQVIILFLLLNSIKHGRAQQL